jgi:hypothetical protein
MKQSFNNLSIAELEELLMEETKKLTSAIREGCSLEEKERMRETIEEIQKLLGVGKTNSSK